MEELRKKRIRLIKNISPLIYLMPFVRCVILNGSMAQGKITRNSDIDLLIIVKNGHIFTARFFSVVTIWMIGLKRSSNEKKPHEGKFCLNYFLNDSYLMIPNNRGEKINKYCAENYSQSILVIGDEIVFNKFIEINMRWMKKYLKARKSIENKKYPVNKSLIRILRFVKVTVEVILEGKIGAGLEKALKHFQIKKIMRDKRISMYPDLIVVNDREMRFHPPKKYSKNI